MLSPLLYVAFITIFVLVFSLTGGGGGGGGGSEKIAGLEQKLFKLQEELTELHRQKGEVCWPCEQCRQCCKLSNKCLVV